MILIAMLGAAFVGLFYAWSEWTKELRAAQSPSWRRATLNVGLLAVTCQAILFVALWTPLNRFHVLLPWCLRLEFLLILLAMPCIFTWKSPARWWLLTASISFGIGSFFSVLAETAI